jgi:hypothetical protein
MGPQSSYRRVIPQRSAGEKSEESVEHMQADGELYHVLKSIFQSKVIESVSFQQAHQVRTFKCMQVHTCNGLFMKGVDQRTLNAAVREFYRHGYAGATSRKIAEMAGVNEVTLFRRFRSKESILRTSITKLRDASQAIDSVFLGEQTEDLRTCLRMR